MLTIIKHNHFKYLGHICRQILSLVLIVSLVMLPATADAATKKKAKQKAQQSKPYVPPYAHILINANTGKILSQNNADQRLYPASLTKLMTLCMVFEALDSRRITLRSSVPMSRHAASMPPSKIGLRVGQSMTVEDAIKSLVTKSANDVATALGEKIGGSESQFAQMMTLKARQIGMSQTNFVNASGLYHSKQVSSARDMGRLALYILHTYPHYYNVFSLKNFYYNGKSIHNHNRLMESYRGMDGMKTGYISQSGFNLVASAKRGNTRLIGVVFGGKTANSRNAKMAELLDSGFYGKAGGQFEDEQRLAQNNAQTVAIPPVAAEKALPSASSPAPILTLTPPSTSDQPAKAPQIQRPEPVRPSEPVQPPAQKVGQTNYVLQKTPSYPSQQKAPVSQAPAAPVSPPVEAAPNLGWSVQIGAFQDRVSTDQALFKAIQKLPAPLNRGKTVIIPLRTSQATWVFRARIGGYTREQAMQACRYLDDCLTISPGSN